MKVIRSIIFLLISSATIFAQNVDFSGQVRARTFGDNRDFNSNTSLFGFSQLRTRLNANFNASKRVSGIIQLQDSRYFGQENTTLSNSQNVDLHQAYINFDDLFKLPVDLRVGRTEYTLGNERLIGAVEWSNVGRSFDGGTLRIKIKTVDVDLFGFNVDENFNAGDSLDNMFTGLIIGFKLFGAHTLEVYGLNNNVYASDELSRTTTGFYLKGKFNHFFHEAEFAYQLGDIIDDDNNLGEVQDINAIYFAYNAGYKFKSRISPVVGLGFDYLSGDKDLTDNKYEVFNTIYATNHKFYGYMDYFLHIPNSTYGRGLMDANVKVSIKPWKPFTAKVHFHVFNSAEDFTLIDGSTSKSFGNELDVVLNYKYSSDVMLEGVFGWFMPGDVFKELKGEDSSIWFYLQAKVDI
jgi:hypothetical protein